MKTLKDVGVEHGVVQPENGEAFPNPSSILIDEDKKRIITSVNELLGRGVERNSLLSSMAKRSFLNGDIAIIFKAKEIDGVDISKYTNDIDAFRADYEYIYQYYGSTEWDLKIKQAEGDICLHFYAKQPKTDWRELEDPTFLQTCFIKFIRMPRQALRQKYIKLKKKYRIATLKKKYFWKKYDGHIGWYTLAVNGVITERFVRKYKNKISEWEWWTVCSNAKLSERFIRENIDKICWVSICASQKLSEGFIREFKDKVDWLLISVDQKLSVAFMDEFDDKIHWNLASIEQKLSEDQIRRHQDEVNWFMLSCNQRFSTEFMIEFYDRLYWRPILKNRWTPIKGIEGALYAFYQDDAALQHLAAEEEKTRKLEAEIEWVI